MPRKARTPKADTVAGSIHLSNQPRVIDAPPISLTDQEIGIYRDTLACLPSDARNNVALRLLAAQIAVATTEIDRCNQTLAALGDTVETNGGVKQRPEISQRQMAHARIISAISKLGLSAYATSGNKADRINRAQNELYARGGASLSVVSSQPNAAPAPDWSKLLKAELK
jgi:hypothetical protein